MTESQIWIEWQPAVRASVRRRGSGFVVSVEAKRDGAWHQAIKLDVFGRAHWHLYSLDGGEQVTPLTGTGALLGGEVVLRDLERHLTHAGFVEVAKQMYEHHRPDLTDGVYEAIATFVGR